jgi:hypothetical protein
MTKLTRLATSTVLTLAFALSALADSQTCPPPIPGEMSSPPCSSTQLTSDDPVQAQTETTATTTAVTETIITDTAIDLVVESILSLF